LCYFADYQLETKWSPIHGSHPGIVHGGLMSKETLQLVFPAS
jgi:hypothetical protein